MSSFEFSPHDRRKLMKILRNEADGKKVRRAEALIRLIEGSSIAEVARHFGVERATIYAWVARFQESDSLDDRHRSGRPDHKVSKTKTVIEQLMTKKPADFGYRGHVWTVPLLHKYLILHEDLDVSLGTIRNGLHALDLSFQRPKYSLARESPTWRHGKGGLREA